VPMTAPEDELLRELERKFPPKNPFPIMMLRTHATSICTAARALNMDPPEMPLLAALPTGTINARTHLAPRATRPLVIFDEDMLLFGDLLAGALALAAVPRDQGRDDKEAGRWMAKAIFSYLTVGHMTILRPRELSGAVRTYAAQLFSGLQLFVVGHEFAHIMAGHLTNAPRRTPPTNEANVISWGHRQEFEADFVGAQLATRAMLTDGVRPVMAYAGTCLYFRLMDVLRRAVSVLSSGAPGSPGPATPTHPSSADRWTILYSMVPGVFDDMDTVLEVQQSLFEWEEIIAGLERPCTAALKRAHADGVRPLERLLRAAREET
jgi:hypothetical protein